MVELSSYLAPLTATCIAVVRGRGQSMATIAAGRSASVRKSEHAAAFFKGGAMHVGVYSIIAPSSAPSLAAGRFSLSELATDDPEEVRSPSYALARSAHPLFQFRKNPNASYVAPYRKAERPSASVAGAIAEQAEFACAYPPPIDPRNVTGDHRAPCASFSMSAPRSPGPPQSRGEHRQSPF